MASIVAISAVQMLKAFMNIDTVFDAQKMGWLVGVHLVFVVSALLLALSLGLRSWWRVESRV
jgi:uncharacterized protein (TIGR00645 family)